DAGGCGAVLCAPPAPFTPSSRELAEAAGGRREGRKRPLACSTVRSKRARASRNFGPPSAQPFFAHFSASAKPLCARFSASAKPCLAFASATLETSLSDLRVLAVCC